MKITTLDLSQHLAQCQQCRRAFETNDLAKWKKGACLLGLKIFEARSDD